MDIKEYTYKNKEEINDIYLYDNMIENIKMNLKNQIIEINMIVTYPEHKLCTLTFENVIHYEFDGLNLWHNDKACVFESYLEKDDVTLKYIEDKIRQEQEKNSDIIFEQDKNKFINMCVKLHSGYEIIIICEKITELYENVKDLVPKDKFDFSNLIKIDNLSDESFKIIAYDMLEWIQDLNWPIAYDVSKILAKREKIVFPLILDVLKTSNDDMWKAWILSLIVPFYTEQSKQTLKPIITKLMNDSKSETLREYATNCYNICYY